MNTDLEKNTRAVFNAIHLQQGESDQIFSRLSSLLTTQYLNLPDDYFLDKVCLDAWMLDVDLMAME